ncbi:hypothetical protein [Shewanella marina]|uniref:hypothetical protein n=1 Tax=Shewanella marina TaxID=487319 RepID=UPI000A5F36DB|nr:hypothetical protein [Shewanella marina]
MTGQCKKLVISNSILWGAAIIAAAILSAPIILTTILLPVLAFISISNIIYAEKQNKI